MSDSSWWQNVNVTDEHGQSPLSLACKEGHVTVVQQLLAAGNLDSILSGPVLRIQDVYPGSRILIFTHPGSWILDPVSRFQ